MNHGKYDRTTPLLCPTCGSDRFEHDNDNLTRITCASCRREMTKDELKDENRENIQVNIDEVTKEIKNDLKKKMKNIFRNNKNITFK